MTTFTVTSIKKGMHGWNICESFPGIGQAVNSAKRLALDETIDLAHVTEYSTEFGLSPTPKERDNARLVYEVTATVTPEAQHFWKQKDGLFFR